MRGAELRRGHEPGRIARVALAVGAPLGVAALASVLWWLSDELKDIGPLDRATFGWGVVMPVWLGVPVAGAFAWRSLGQRDVGITAAIFATIVGAVAAGLLWQAVAHPDCQFGAIHDPGFWVVPSLIVGAVIGGGPALSALLALTPAEEGRRWRAVIVGAGAELIFVAIAIAMASMWLLQPLCQRPP